MKKWRVFANPADPSAWADVSNMWPTGRGSYETADYYTTTLDITATSEGGPLVSAWMFSGISASKIYVIGDYIWSLNASLTTATDRTGALGANAVDIATGGHACQYGDVTIITRGSGASGGTLISATTGNFAAIAGSPAARFVVAQSNAVVAFNTSANADAWHASDVGDYTNWTTGEAASGRILENNGPITGAIPHGNDIIVFKEDAIFRMTYVGGQVKWQIQRIWNGLGLADRQWYGSALSSTGASNGCSAVVDTPLGLFFPGQSVSNGNSTRNTRAYYLFDTVSPPRCVSGDVVVGTDVGLPVFDAATNIVTVFGYEADSTNTINTRYYYNILDDAWGKSSASSAGQPHIPLRGASSAGTHLTGGDTPNRQFFTYGTNKLVRNYAITPATSGAHTSFIQSHKFSGQQSGVFGNAQWTFGPAALVLRARNNSGTNPALAMTVDTYQEAHDTSAAATASVTESTQRDRFDFTKNDSFCQLKLSVTDAYIDIDDISVQIKPAGRV